MAGLRDILYFINNFGKRQCKKTIQFETQTVGSFGNWWLETHPLCKGLGMSRPPEHVSSTRRSDIQNFFFRSVISYLKFTEDQRAAVAAFAGQPGGISPGSLNGERGIVCVELKRTTANHIPIYRRIPL